MRMEPLSCANLMLSVAFMHRSISFATAIGELKLAVASALSCILIAGSCFDGDCWLMLLLGCLFGFSLFCRCLRLVLVMKPCSSELSGWRSLVSFLVVDVL